MQSSLFLLLFFLPLSISIKCFIGTEGNFIQDSCKGNAKGSDFCYKQTTAHAIESNKDCGFGFCTKDGCMDGICCCSSGDYCNSAAGGSLMTTLVAAAAAWLRL